jgi:Crinkler effector protein N-terminal domain
MDTMDVDDNTRKLELNFILLKQGLAYGSPTFRTLTVPSSCKLSKLREVIRDKCSWLLEAFDPADLNVYKASLLQTESKALLQQLKSGSRIATSEWKTSLLDDLDLLSDSFTKQPDERAIHLIVDCTNAGELRAISRIWQCRLLCGTSSAR